MWEGSLGMAILAVIVVVLVSAGLPKMGGLLFDLCQLRAADGVRAERRG